MTKSRWIQGTARGVVLALAAAAALFIGEAKALAQAAADTNLGALHFTGGADVPSVYVFRGFIQEENPKLTLFPYGDLAIALTSGDGTVRSTVVNVGVWNSLNTGSSGTDGITGHAHYEEEFYARLNWLFGGGIAVGVGYMARTSPNNMFDTEKEFQIKVAKSGRVSPYVFLASELTAEGQADSGIGKGTYLEVGAVPNVAVGRRARLAVPAKVGLSLHDYYELAGENHPFGYFNVGAMLTWPLGAVAERFGSWNVHGGAEFYVLGDATKVSNNGDTLKPVAFVGVGVTY